MSIMASEINGKSTLMYQIIQANNEQNSNFRITIIVGGSTGDRYFIHKWPVMQKPFPWHDVTTIMI